MLRYIWACKSPFEPAALHSSTSVSMRPYCSTYEHLSLHASLLLHIRARKSPYAHTPLHTSTPVSMRVCCSTYEHVSRYTRMLHYL
ncbi:hypothetical protein Hanom_Chr04g00360531 [Helianthus anomalus]